MHTPELATGTTDPVVLSAPRDTACLEVEGRIPSQFSAKCQSRSDGNNPELLRDDGHLSSFCDSSCFASTRALRSTVIVYTAYTWSTCQEMSCRRPSICAPAVALPATMGMNMVTHGVSDRMAGQQVLCP